MMMMVIMTMVTVRTPQGGNDEREVKLNPDHDHDDGDDDDGDDDGDDDMKIIWRCFYFP